MRIEPNQLIALGYGKYVRSDDVVAIEPVTQARGPGRRCFVWVRGLGSPLIASRSGASIVEELTAPSEEPFRTRQQKALLRHLLETVDDIPGSFRRRLRDAEGVDLDHLAQEAQRLLA
jgi:hypothetical protein